MERKLVYDLPTRIFHWLFAGLFLSAFVIGKTVDDESTLFSLHSILGILMVLVVLMRIIWGLVGSKTSRFSSYVLKPRELKAYFFGLLGRDSRAWSGHNPASSWAALLMFLFALGLGVTGYQMALGRESAEDLHEVFGNLLLITAAVHVAGVILHNVRHRDSIQLSMISGTKASLPEGEYITSHRPLSALVALGILVFSGVHIYKNFDPNSQKLTLFGTSLQLGEVEEEGGGNKGGHHGEHEDSERDEED